MVAHQTPVARRLPAAERRQQLVEVAVHLFAQRGFTATTMDDIAEAAGVTKPLLYQHFASKRALYLELADQVARSLLETVGEAMTRAEGGRQRVEAGFSAYFALAADHEDAFGLLFGNDSPHDAELSAAVRGVEDVMARAIAEQIDADLEPDHRLLLASAVVGMARAATRRFLDTQTAEGHADPDEPERLARRIGHLAWAGLRSVHRDP